jgi:hypothetical protein
VPYFLQVEAAKQNGESRGDIERPVAAFADNINHQTAASTGSEIQTVESNNHTAANDNDSISDDKSDNSRESQVRQSFSNLSEGAALTEPDGSQHDQVSESQLKTSESEKIRRLQSEVAELRQAPTISRNIFRFCVGAGVSVVRSD